MIQIREVTAADIETCASLLMDAYNCEPWNNGWTMETASRYLSEFIAADRFKGFLLICDDAVVGALLGHSRTWWTGDEIFIDELYVATAMQRNGLGRMLLDQAEDYAKSQGFNGLTLLTDRRMPAKIFYLKNGFQEAEQVLFLYKVFQ